MSGQNTPSNAPQDRAGRTADKNVEAGVEGTFPASDPTSTNESQGARAVPPEDIMHPSGSTPEHGQHGGTAALTARFESQEAAKLAVEALVRDGPVDRRCAEIQSGDDAGTTLRLNVPETDRQRLEGMLRKQNGVIG